MGPDAYLFEKLTAYLHHKLGINHTITKRSSNTVTLQPAARYLSPADVVSKTEEYFRQHHVTLRETSRLTYDLYNKHGKRFGFLALTPYSKKSVCQIIFTLIILNHTSRRPLPFTRAL